jgi:lysylphosphatidylglycerol synthetase-like protein (DUF2156 family)
VGTGAGAVTAMGAGAGAAVTGAGAAAICCITSDKGFVSITVSFGHKFLIASSLITTVFLLEFALIIMFVLANLFLLSVHPFFLASNENKATSIEATLFFTMSFSSPYGAT